MWVSDRETRPLKSLDMAWGEDDWMACAVRIYFDLAEASIELFSGKVRIFAGMDAHDNP